MAQYWLRALVCASLICWAFTQTCQGASMQLNAHLNLAARQFLIANNQKIVIVFPAPLSAGGTAVIAAKTLQPISDLTTLTLDTANEIYISSGPVVALDTIKVGIQSPATYDKVYSFDGVQINGNGSGLSGHIGIYYQAPLHAQAVVTGLAAFIYETGTEKPSTPSPINYYTLNLFQTQYIKQPTSVVWVFVASEISSGSVLPFNILNPAPTRVVLKSNSGPQIGGYLAVSLSSESPANIHFDSSINAFVNGPYPTSE